MSRPVLAALKSRRHNRSTVPVWPGSARFGGRHGLGNQGISKIPIYQGNTGLVFCQW
jgi:hypothetical protein